MADNVFNFLDDSTLGAEANEPTGKAPQTDEFSVAFQKLNQQSDFERQQASRPQSLTERFNAPVGPSTFTYVPDEAVEPYRYQKGFEADFFNALSSANYQRYADRETFGSALSKGLDSFAYKFGNTFVDYWKGYGRMADALVHMDWDRMKPDEETLATQYYKDQLDMKRNFVFEQPENEDSIFSKRTMSEFIGNAGFALGTFAGLGIEIAADIAITAATGGAGAVTFGATAARVGARQAAAQTAKSGFRFADALTDVAKGFSYGNKSIDEISAAAKVAEKIDETAALASMGRSTARDAMSETFTVFSNNFFNIAKSKNLAEASANLLKGTPLVGTGIRYGEKLAAASKAGASTGQMIGIGLQGLRRVAQELNMSSTEASFEAVTSYGDTLDKMVKQYQIDNDGAVPTAKEFEEMRSLAMQASTANYNTNLGLLLATNKLQFGNLFNRFIPANKFMTEAAENVMVINSKAGKALIDKSGFFGSYGVLGKVAKEFAKKEAAWQFSKAFTKDFLRFEVLEGLQENLQETSAAAWRDYYAGQFNGLETSLSDAFGQGASEQFTKQGLKTFLMGAFTGSLIRVPTALASSSFEAANRALINREYAKTPELNPYKRAEEQFKKDLEIQNALFKQAKEGSFKEKIVNFVAQTDAAQQQAEAAAKGLRYEFENGRDNALLAAVASAQRTNSVGMLQRAIKDMGKDMSAEEFEKSFGVKLEDTKYKSASEFSEAVARDVKKYSDVIEGLRTKFKSTMANPAQYDKGSRGQYVATLMRGAQEEAIQVLALNAIKGDMSANRAKQIAEELMSAPGIGTSADYALRALTNATSLQGEIKSLYAEIRILQEQLKAEGLDAETKSRIKEQLNSKIKEEELLSKWASYWEVRDSIIGYDKDNQPVKSKQIADVFIGKSIDKTQTVTDENGNEVKTVDRTFDPTDREVVETFRQLMNIKNKQAGNSTEISEEVMRDSFQKIYDYIRLDRDTKDYMRSVDVLMNPDNFRQMQERMVDGKFKFNLILYVDKLDDDLYNRTLEILNDLTPGEQDAVNIIEDLRSTLVDSENYKNLLVVIANPDMSIEQEDYAFKLYEGIVQDLLKKEAEIRVRYAPKEYTDDISQEDFDEIMATGELDPVIKYLIADKLSQGIALSEREEKVYKRHKDAIDKETSSSKTPVTSGTSVDPAEQTPAVELPPIIIVGPDGEEVIEETPATVVSDIEGQVGTSNYSVNNGLIFYNNPNGTVTPVANPKGKPVMDVIIDDIERRRQEELATIPKYKIDYSDKIIYLSEGTTKENYKYAAGNYKVNSTGSIDEPLRLTPYPLPIKSGIREVTVYISISELKTALTNTINAKYNAELDALEGKSAPTDIETKKAYIERRRQEALNAKDKQSGKFKKDLDTDIIEKRRIIDEFIKNKGKNLENIEGWNDLRGDIQELLFEGKFDEAKAKVPQTYEEKINAKYDAEYVNAVKKGEMTKEQAMQALKEVGRKDSVAYAELAVLEGKPAPTAVSDTDVSDTETKKAYIERRRQEAKNSLWERTKLEEALLRDKKELERTGRVDNRASSALRQTLKNKEDEIDKEYDNIILKEFGELEYKKTKILREKKNLEEYFSKSPTTDYMELENRKRRLAKYDEEVAVLERSKPAPTTETFTDSVDDANLAFFGISTQTAVTEQETALEQETPFAATGTEEQGYDVVDRNNNAVNPEKIPSAEQAVELAESMNTTRADLDFVQKLMGTTDATMVTKALEIFQKSMEQYNKRKKTSFATLEEYYKTPDGKRLIEANKEALITGKPVNYKQKSVAAAVNPVTNQMTLFDSPASGNVASLTLSSLESLHAKVKEFREQALQDSTKFSKFVETGNVPSAPITEASILNKLQDITRCFS